MNDNDQIWPQAANRTHAQRGLSLVVVLLFLVAITSVAVLSARKAILQEGSGRNQLDMEVARQAAESALRDAERDLSSTVMDTANASCIRPEILLFDIKCPTGLCRKEIDSATPSTYANSDWSAAKAGSTDKSEPWWPTSKGGLWEDSSITDDPKNSNKPWRTPKSSDHCSTFTGGVPLGTYTGAAAISGVAVQPEYLIEYFLKKDGQGGQDVDTYRITARGFGYTRRTQVVLQTVFVTSDAE
jgi:type IV pilus assembly protein PilX